MMRVGVIPNLYKEENILVTKKAAVYLLEKKCTVFLPMDAAKKIGLPHLGVPVENIYTSADFIVVLGGDGTLLNVGRQAAVFDIPILGINSGTLGFLTDVEANEYQLSIDKALEGAFKTEKRLMIEGRILRKGVAQNPGIALNDICITRGVFSKIIVLKVFINGEFVDRYRADGVIISTPTGSTAYNLSAGGPILKPDTQMVAITPICPHSLHARSIITSAEDTIEVEIDRDSRGDVLVSFDGQKGEPLGAGEKVEIKKSSCKTSIMKTGNTSFYHILRKKLVKNEG